MINLNSKKWLLICLSSVFLSACDPNFNSPVGDTSSYSAGDADFSNYVAVGDSLTAGYADGALYRLGQESSFPNILATQFKTVGGGVFNQPLMNDNLGGLLFGTAPNPSFANRLVLDAATSPPSPGAIVGTPTNEVFSSPLIGTTFNNTGVPGAKSFHLGAPGYGSAGGLLVEPVTANPYFVRFASSATTTIITDAANQMPTFFTLWIGNNDVLSYATGGGTGTDQTGNFDPTSYGSSDITDPNVFASTYAGLVGALTANPATKGVLINIPDVSTIPYFTTVPHNPVPLDQATVDALTTAYAGYNGALQFAAGQGVITAGEAMARKIEFSAGLTNALVILDESLTDLTSNMTIVGALGAPTAAALVNMRQATADDLVVLPSSSKIGTLADPNNPLSAIGIAVPLGDADVLIKSEIDAVNTARIAYNVTIKAAADANANLAFFDASAFMTELKANGISFGTGDITATYATGGGFSLDGVHPTARGYSVIANGIIDTINTAFNSSIPRVDPVTFTTIFLK
ncbi:MAG: lysophospholipase L1-like esterase [Gammaproteobacteria bacterium]|jgi:lysophospholipase L1-like esterase